MLLLKARETDIHKTTCVETLRPAFILKARNSPVNGEQAEAEPRDAALLPRSERATSGAQNARGRPRNSAVRESRAGREEATRRKS